MNTYWKITWKRCKKTLILIILSNFSKLIPDKEMYKWYFIFLEEPNEIYILTLSHNCIICVMIHQMNILEIPSISFPTGSRPLFQCDDVTTLLWPLAQHCWNNWFSSPDGLLSAKPIEYNFIYWMVHILTTKVTLRYLWFKLGSVFLW